MGDWLGILFVTVLAAVLYACVRSNPVPTQRPIREILESIEAKIAALREAQESRIEERLAAIQKDLDILASQAGMTDEDVQTLTAQLNAAASLLNASK